MKIYFTTRHIPELSGLDFQQRMSVVKKAVNLLPVPRKILLNILKLVILTNFFAIFARFEGWILAPYLLLAGLSYPLIINPVTYQMTRSQLAGAREKIQL